MFEQMTSLIKLILSYNSLKDVYVKGLKTLVKLSLDSNKLTQVPKWCNNLDLSHVQNLKHHNLGSNNIGDLGNNTFQVDTWLYLGLYNQRKKSV